MFDIGFSEVLLIFGLALVVLGPDKLPGVARTIGRWAGRARAMARQFRDQLETEADGLKVDLNTPPQSSRHLTPSSRLRATDKRRSSRPPPPAAASRNSTPTDAHRCGSTAAPPTMDSAARFPARRNAARASA